MKNTLVDRRLTMLVGRDIDNVVRKELRRVQAPVNRILNCDIAGIAAVTGLIAWGNIIGHRRLVGRH